MDGLEEAMARQHRVRGEYQPELDWIWVTRSVTVRGGLLEDLALSMFWSKCFQKGNDFLKRMMMFLRCYGWIYFLLSLFLFRVFCGVSSQTDLVSHKGFKNWECWLDWHWYCWYQFSLFPFYLSFFWVVALGRQFTEPLSADAALSPLCGAKRPAQYKSNPDQKWISIQQCCDKILTNKYFTLCTNVTVYLFSSRRKSN